MKIINKQIKIEIEAIVNLFIDSITSKKKKRTNCLYGGSGAYWNIVAFAILSNIGSILDCEYTGLVYGYLTFGNKYVSAV